MNPRTRKWGCAFGITLLIAVPVALALWLGLVLMRPPSAQDELRAIPLYPGAIHAIYETPDSFGLRGSSDKHAQVTYIVKDSAEVVHKFYARNLPSRGWKTTSGAQDQEVYLKSWRYVSGFRLSEHAPWVQLLEVRVTSILMLQTMPTRIDGVDHTNVTVHLGVMERNQPYIP